MTTYSLAAIKLPSVRVDNSVKGAWSRVGYRSKLRPTENLALKLIRLWYEDYDLWLMLGTD